MLTEQLRDFSDEDIRLASSLLSRMDDDLDASAHLLMVVHQLKELLALAGSMKDGSDPGVAVKGD